MIVIEERISDMVKLMPEITINEDYCSKPKFHWGDRKELTKYLTLNEDNSYPLIWLLLGIDKYTDRGIRVERECQFIICTRESDKALLNNQRYEKSYKLVLNPLLELFVEGLRNSSISRLTSEDWEVERRPDYTDSYYKGDNDNYTIDMWDAIKLVVNVEFNNNCLKTPKSWQTT